MNNGRIVAGADYVAATPGGYDGTGVRAEVFDGGVDTDHRDFPNPVPIHGAVDRDQHHPRDVHLRHQLRHRGGFRAGNGHGPQRISGILPTTTLSTNRYEPHRRTGRSGTRVQVRLPVQLGGDHPQDTATTPRSRPSWTTSSGNTDITIFQSQSNAGDQYSRPQAWAKNIVSVGGARHYNNPNPDGRRVGSGASIGPAADGRVKPDLTFFYDSIYTTDAEPGGYSAGDYTGVSVAHRARLRWWPGHPGLFFQMWQDNVWGTAPGSGTVFDERPHFSTMKALLINNAEQYDWTTTNPNLTRFRQGWGRPNAQNAYDRAPITAVIDESSVLEELQKDIFTADRAGRTGCPQGDDGLRRPGRSSRGAPFIGSTT